MKKTLSIVIPVFNEEKRLATTFRELRSGFHSHALKLEEVVFVDDGSTDKTLRILKKFQREYSSNNLQINIVSYPKNRGKGYAVKQGMLAAKADYALLCDADMSTPLSEISKFDTINLNKFEVVVGTRKNGKATIEKKQPFYRQVLGKLFTRLSRFILGIEGSDFTCGFKLFSKKAREDVFANSIIYRWAYDAEALFLTQKNGYKVAEIAVVWNNDEGTKVTVVKDGIVSFIDLVKIRLYNVLGLYDRAVSVDPQALSWLKDYL